MAETVKKDTVWSWLFRVVKGAIIGVGAVLPGISGGVLSVVFGIYKPMMEFLAHPIKSFKKQFGFFLPIVIGFLFGFIVLSKMVAWLFDTYEIQSLWLFIGLIVGTFPSLFKEAGEQGRTKGSWVSFGIALVVVGALLFLLSDKVSSNISPNFWWFIVCGVFWGGGMIIPGLSPSNFLIFLGLYKPMTEGIGNLDFNVLVPMVIGLLAVMFLLSKPMNWLLKKAYSATFHAILGSLVASTIAIIPMAIPGSFHLGQIFGMIACFVVGLAVAVVMGSASSKLDSNVSAELDKPQ